MQTTQSTEISKSEAKIEEPIKDSQLSIEELEARELNKEFHRLFGDRINKFGDVKVGRNEKCPCGSEKKFKKCCGGI